MNITTLIMNGWIWIFKKPFMASVIQKYLKPSDAINACFAFCIPLSKIVEIRISGSEKYECVFGIRHRKSEILSKKGHVKRIENYLDGVLHGVSVNHNPKITLVSNYSHGKLDGEQLEYFSEGKLRSKCHYKNGVLHGEAIKYYRRGNVMEESHYNNGERITFKSYTYNPKEAYITYYRGN